MISCTKFNISKKKDNKKITINFKASSFKNDRVCFYIFKNKLNTKLKINISKLFNNYIEILEKVDKIKNFDSKKIYHDLESMFINFSDLKNDDDKIKKITKILDYILLNKSYFNESEYAMKALERKLIKIFFYDKKKFKVLKYYYFFIFQVNSIKIEYINNEIKFYDNHSEEVDFFFDNPSDKIIWCEIKHDLNFY